MRFVFDEQKSAEAAAYLLRLADGPLPQIKLLKLLYIADRQALKETGYPITGARMVSMEHGPVLSQIYDRMTLGDARETPWSLYIRPPRDFEVSLRIEPEWLNLSDYDRDLLGLVWARFGAMDRWALVRLTREFPEWTDPIGSSVDIDPAVILREAGWPEAEIRAAAENAEGIRALHTILAAS